MKTLYNWYFELHKIFCNNLQFSRRARTFTQMTHVSNGVKKTICHKVIADSKHLKIRMEWNAATLFGWFHCLKKTLMYSLHKDGTSLSISSHHYGHIMSTSYPIRTTFLILTLKHFESKSSYIFSNVLLIIAIPKFNLSLCVRTTIKGIAIPF